MKRLGGILLLIALSPACTPVAAWERGTLATERMQLDLEPDEAALVVSRRRVREEGTIGGSAGGPSSGGGGGCGCN